MVVAVVFVEEGWVGSADWGDARDAMSSVPCGCDDAAGGLRAGWSVGIVVVWVGNPRGESKGVGQCLEATLCLIIHSRGVLPALIRGVSSADSKCFIGVFPIPTALDTTFTDVVSLK